MYDIGEAENTPFISMEFIDGEDLQALLTRVGRLTSQQGLDLAKQMAVGIHAAHQKGIIHRDLKPANIMVDSQGQVRITDFGLAQLTVDAGAGQLAGTPAYMAPEQLRGGEVSVQSDLYALGLILYEMFAGQAVHDVRSLSDAVRIRSRDTAVSLSSFNADLDSAVEQAIEGCLRHDPVIRVKSALTVFQSLPGNSPLEASLAMGYTPSPEQVAASVEQPLPNTTCPVVDRCWQSGLQPGAERTGFPADRCPFREVARHDAHRGPRVVGSNRDSAFDPHLCRTSRESEGERL